MQDRAHSLTLCVLLLRSKQGIRRLFERVVVAASQGNSSWESQLERAEAGFQGNPACVSSAFFPFFSSCTLCTTHISLWLFS
jgi:hypothetical protein